MTVNNVKVISKCVSKKGTLMVSISRGADKLCDNCFVSNPMAIDFSPNDIVSGELIFNNNGMNTFILLDKIK